MSLGAIADVRISRLEKQQARRSGSVQSDSQSFTISPTCPPSTSITFRGGLAWWTANAFRPYGYYIPTYTVDLADPSKTSVRVAFSAYTYTFTNAGWYAPCVIILSRAGLGTAQDPWPDTVPDDTIYLYGGVASPYLAEYETAAEAEVALDAIRLQTADGYGILASGLILRNNGNVAQPNQYENINKVSRGGSYLFRYTRVGWEMG